MWDVPLFLAYLYNFIPSKRHGRCLYNFENSLLWSQKLQRCLVTLQHGDRIETGHSAKSVLVDVKTIPWILNHFSPCSPTPVLASRYRVSHATHWSTTFGHFSFNCTPMYQPLYLGEIQWFWNFMCLHQSGSMLYWSSIAWAEITLKKHLKIEKSSNGELKP